MNAGMEGLDATIQNLREARQVGHHFHRYSSLVDKKIVGAAGADEGEPCMMEGLRKGGEARFVVNADKG
jgi:hypothetical protein